MLRGTDADQAKSSLWNCQSFKSGFGDDRFPLLHHFGDKFSVGAVNFHSIGQLIVGYLIEQSMWRNSDNSEHLFGLTEGKRSVANFTGDLINRIWTSMNKRNFSCFLALRERTIPTLHMKYQDIRRNLSTWRFYVSPLSFEPDQLSNFMRKTTAKTKSNRMSALLLWTEIKRRQRAILNERRRRRLKPVSLASTL